MDAVVIVLSAFTIAVSVWLPAESAVVLQPFKTPLMSPPRVYGATDSMLI